MRKPIIWLADSKKKLRAMPEDVKDEVGYTLDVVQSGGTPNTATRMKDNLREVSEIRVDHAGNTYRTMYTTAFPGVVYVLDAFRKKSKTRRKTPLLDLDRILKRLRAARAHYAECGPPGKHQEGAAFLDGRW